MRLYFFKSEESKKQPKIQAQGPNAKGNNILKNRKRMEITRIVQTKPL